MRKVSRVGDHPSRQHPEHARGVVEGRDRGRGIVGTGGRFDRFDRFDRVSDAGENDLEHLRGRGEDTIET